MSGTDIDTDACIGARPNFDFGKFRR
jgi:hypothetical protein